MLVAVAVQVSSAHFVTVAEAMEMMKRRRAEAKSNPLSIMTQIMAKGQAGMAQAQRQRDQAVTVLRGTAVDNFDRAAASLGDAIGKYESELAAHELALEAAANVSATGLAKNAPTPGELDFAKNRQRSKLKVEIDGAKQQVASGRLRDETATRQATEAGVETIKGEAAEMARKLGSLSPEVQNVEKILQQHILEASEALVHPPANASETHMDVLVKELRAREAETARSVKAARKELQDAVAQAGLKLQAEDKKVMENLDAPSLKALHGIFAKSLERKAAEHAKLGLKHLKLK